MAGRWAAGGFPPANDQLLEYRLRLIERLEQQPAEFAAAIAVVPAQAWHQRADRDGRSVHQIAAHVRDLEAQAFLPRVRRILAEDVPALTPYAHHDWSADGYDPAEPMTTIFEAWSRARAELVHLLRPLDGAGWSRLGFHPPSGRRTVQWWAERAYTHVAEHLEALRAAA